MNIVQAIQQAMAGAKICRESWKRLHSRKSYPLYYEWFACRRSLRMRSVENNRSRTAANVECGGPITDIPIEEVMADDWIIYDEPTKQKR